MGKSRRAGVRRWLKRAIPARWRRTEVAVDWSDPYPTSRAAVQQVATRLAGGHWESGSDARRGPSNQRRYV